MNILIFGGTTEGRMLSSKLLMYHDITLIVATDYGEKLIEKQSNLKIIANKLNEKQMTTLIKEKNFDIVIDTTHPFALNVTENIKNACNKLEVKYIRLIREVSKKNDNIMYFENYESVCQFLNNTHGNILLTTGSKNLEEFTKIHKFDERIYVRVIPMMSSLQKCIELGFLQKNIICMQGPFSYELNKVIINDLDIKFLVTKDSGKIGGLQEKILAGLSMGITIIVIKRPNEEQGLKFDEVLKYFEIY